MSGQPEMPTPDTPQVLLEHHLKALRLPTMQREYDKVARQCAQEKVDFPRYLLRLTELQLLDRERRATRAPYPASEVSGDQEPRQLRLLGPPLAQQDAGAGTGSLRVPGEKGKSFTSR